jgi:hypothetical protein
MFFQQPPRQGIGGLAGPILSLGKGDQPVLAILPEHHLKRCLGLNQKPLS